MNADLVVSSMAGAISQVNASAPLAAANDACATPDKIAATTPQTIAVAIALGRASLKLSMMTRTARNTSTGTHATVTLASSAISGVFSARSSLHDVEIRLPRTQSLHRPTG